MNINGATHVCSLMVKSPSDLLNFNCSVNGFAMPARAIQVKPEMFV